MCRKYIDKFGGITNIVCFVTNEMHINFNRICSGGHVSATANVFQRRRAERHRRCQEGQAWGQVP